jgi:hypothetical protein
MQTCRVNIEEKLLVSAVTLKSFGIGSKTFSKLDCQIVYLAVIDPVCQKISFNVLSSTLELCGASFMWFWAKVSVASLKTIVK